jgi:hypothetical protein
MVSSSCEVLAVLNADDEVGGDSGDGEFDGGLDEGSSFIFKLERSAAWDTGTGDAVADDDDASAPALRCAQTRFVGGVP